MSAPFGRDPRAASEALHARVRRFAESVESPPLVPAKNAETFETLARSIFEFQLEESPGYRRLIETSAFDLDDIDTWPALPVDAFRLARVAVHPPELDRLVFETSGTTGSDSGRHAFRSLETYETLALTLARKSLFARKARGVVVAVAPDPGLRPTSSLAYMMRLFMERFDGRALSAEPEGASYGQSVSERWLIEGGQVNVERLERAARLARKRSEPLFVLGASFAFAALLEALDGETVRGPSETYVMTTGGFKGRRNELSAEALAAELARALGTTEGAVLGEYGMTELTSQLYEGWSGTASRAGPTEDPVKRARSPAFFPEVGRRGLYFAPPWLRVTAVDPSTGRRLPQGEEGVARFVDLGNVDSALVIVTEDRIVETEGGVELRGRRPKAPARGCSLPFEGLLTRVPRGSAESRRRVPSTLPSAPASRPERPSPHLEERLRRMHALERAALEVQSPRTELGRRARALLTASTGLSPEGVEYALSECFEASAGRAALGQLALTARPAPRSFVLLSANVFTGAYRAIQLALAQSPSVTVRASRRDDVLPRLLFEASNEAFALTDELSPAPSDHVWAYGSDETLTKLRDQLPGGVRLHAHGSGMGVVVAREPHRGTSAPLEEAADLLAEDTLAFDQRGCASPRLVFIQGSKDFARDFARLTARALESWELTVPRGSLSPDEAIDVHRFVHVARFAFECFEAGTGLVTLDTDGGTLLVPPVGRYLHFVRVDDPLLALAPLMPKVTTVAFFDPGNLPGECHARFGPRRYVSLGKMQRPLLDGPVDLRPGPEAETI